MTQNSLFDALPDDAVKAIRTAAVFASIAGIVLGLIMLIWPKATLIVIAVLFGIALILTGIFRVYIAFAISALPGGIRAFYGILGAAILVLGIIALFHPGQSLWILAIFIGVGWIFDGIQTLIDTNALSMNMPKWWVITSGVISILAGIAVLSLGAASIGVFIWVGGILLIVISVINLFRLPKKTAPETFGAA